MQTIGFKDILCTQTIPIIMEQINAIISSGGHIDDINALLNPFESRIPAFCCFFRAKFYFKKGKYQQAQKQISNAYEQIEQDLTHAPFLRTVIYNIYEFAGEIYANNDEYEKSLHAYQDYLLCASCIQSMEISEVLSFRPCNLYSILDLVNQEITVCNPHKMNDPFDTLILKWGEFLKKDKAEKKHIGPLCEALESYKIRSFTKIKGDDGKDLINNILLWSHYADNHEGL